MKKIEKESVKKTGKVIVKLLKAILFVTMIGLTYIVSDKVVDYLMSLDIILLKRALNIILVIIVVFIAMYRKK